MYLQKGKWETGRVSGGVYSGDEKHMQLLDEAYRYIMSQHTDILCRVRHSYLCAITCTVAAPSRLYTSA
jgi:hypothetical protein